MNRLRNFLAVWAAGMALWSSVAQGALVERFAPLRLGEVAPAGWLLDQIRMDITNGYGPHLDRLTDRINLREFDCRTKTELVKPKIGGDWWNGETTGNWLDGFIRTAYLSGDLAAKKRIDELVAQILSFQEADGYLGMYPKARRFESPIAGQNGEFWTQACLYRGLLAYYELTGRAEVLAAVERAVKLAMSHYGPAHPYWGPKVQRGGPTHDLMFTDVCEQLWHATGNQAYADFARFLYDTYNERTDVFETSVMLRNLADANQLFNGHGAHVMEHLRAPLLVACASGDPKYRAAVDNIFPKTDRHLAPGGACVSDEDIMQRLGSPDIGCEYCTMLELLHTLESGAQKLGRAELGDRLEALAFNSAEGARLRDGRAIQYCTRDNQHEASIAAGRGSRFKLSPTHEDVAVCCPVTALKFFPYFVGGLWLKERDGSGLVALAYAPNVLRTTLRGVAVAIRSETLYPFEDTVRLTVQADKPVRFSLRLREPAWAGKMDVAAAGAEAASENGWRVVAKEWRSGDNVTLSFTPEIVRRTPPNGRGVYWQRGPLVYALPIAGEAKKTKSYPVPGFADWDYVPAANAFWNYAVNTNCGQFALVRRPAAPGGDPWTTPPLALSGTLLNRQSNQPETVRLVPLGSALLRHTVFEDADRKVTAAQLGVLASAANVARKAEVTVANSAKGYRPTAIFDGIVDGFPDHPEAEWASAQGGVGTKVKLHWEMPETVDSVWLFDRPNPADQVLGATLKFSDGSTAEVGELPNDASAPFRLKFAPKTITWLEITITRVSRQTHNVGFSEIAVFEAGSSQSSP